MEEQKKKHRLLIFVIAYQAEKTIDWVLNRIPQEIFDTYECHVLVVDDASNDKTFEMALKYKNQHGVSAMTVLKNGYNQGYGGNQKVGYSYALKEGYDFVAMLHGDGQYAPEELANLLRPLQNGEADVVLGSRMIRSRAALRGGMPLYKYVGNRILTSLQNRMLRTHLSEFHSGYRVYSTAVLQKIPFLLNTNDFHFDTEILIQLFNLKARILELPIPTYYGDEICYVNGMGYAFNVLVATFKNVLHKSGILYQRRYDTDPPEDCRYDLKFGYPSSHTAAFNAIPERARVMDIGGAQGHFSEYLQEKKQCEVSVVDQYRTKKEPDKINFTFQSLDEPLKFSIENYEYILLLDVLEHLKDPETFLQNLREQFTYEHKTVIISTPNIAFFVQRLMLLFGQFNYGRIGILDLTHTRLFTFRTLKYLLRDAGFRIKKISGIPAPFAKAIGKNRISRFLAFINQLLITVARSLFSYQIFVIAESTPSVNYVLENSKRISEKQDDTLGEAETEEIFNGTEMKQIESSDHRRVSSQR